MRAKSIRAALLLAVSCRGAITRAFWAAVAVVAWCSIAAAQLVPGGGGTTTDPYTVYDSTVNTTLQGATPPGSFIIGKVGVDQSTPGTSNAVQPVDSMVLGPFSCASAGCVGVAIGPVVTAGYGSMVLSAPSLGTGGSFTVQGTTDPACATGWQTNIPVTILSTGQTSLGPSSVGAVVLNTPLACYQVVLSGWASGTYTVRGELRAAKAVFDYTIPVLTTGSGWTSATQGSVVAAAQTIKSSGGELSYLECYNPNVTVAWAQLYNSVSPTLGSGLIQVYAIPPLSSFVALQSGQHGLNFSSAISISAATTYNGNTAPGTGLTCNEGYN